MHVGRNPMSGFPALLLQIGAGLCSCSQKDRALASTDMVEAVRIKYLSMNQ